MNTIGKIMTLTFWLLAAVSYVSGATGLLAWLPTLGVIIFVAHIAETAYFWLNLRQYSQQPEKDAALVMVFGMFHMQSFIKKAKA